ncbi:hypothetical protein [Nocardia sp. NPDC058705]|uniref:hypothetical protein n=1 Tax=Nocardia sp. NPDC058705 TaxID=3346609 RepID=UPI0036CFA142
MKVIGAAVLTAFIGVIIAANFSAILGIALLIIAASVLVGFQLRRKGQGTGASQRHWGTRAGGTAASTGWMAGNAGSHGDGGGSSGCGGGGGGCGGGGGGC